MGGGKPTGNARAQRPVGVTSTASHRSFSAAFSQPTPRAGPLKGTILNPNEATYGFKQRIDVERKLAGIDRADAVLEAGTQPHMGNNLRTFLSAHEAKARYGGAASAASGTLVAAPKQKIEYDSRHAAVKEMQGNQYFPKHKLDFMTNEPLRDCVFSDAAADLTQFEKKKARDHIRRLKAELHEQRKSRRDMESAAQAAGEESDVAAPLPPSRLPKDWFETRDAQGRVIWCHMLTHHAVYERPTAATKIAPTHEAVAAASSLPPFWYETVDAEGKRVWRNSVTMDLSRERPVRKGAPSGTTRLNRPPIPCQLRTTAHLGHALGKLDTQLALVK